MSHPQQLSGQETGDESGTEGSSPDDDSPDEQPTADGNDSKNGDEHSEPDSGPGSEDTNGDAEEGDECFDAQIDCPTPSSLCNEPYCDDHQRCAEHPLPNGFELSEEFGPCEAQASEDHECEELRLRTTVICEGGEERTHETREACRASNPSLACGVCGNGIVEPSMGEMCEPEIGNTACNTNCKRPIFVDADAQGRQDGSSWKNSFTDLQNGLAEARALVSKHGAPIEVWVANGVYRPHESNRNVGFKIPAGVQVFGGFSGYAGESSSLGDEESKRSQRPNFPEAHDPLSDQFSHLTGDLLLNDRTSEVEIRKNDNSYSVIDLSESDQDSRLDGFVIRDGFSNGGGWGEYNEKDPDFVGAGIFIPTDEKERNVGTLANLWLFSNHAKFLSGAIHNPVGSTLALEGAVTVTVEDRQPGQLGNNTVFNAGNLQVHGSLTINSGDTGDSGNLYNARGGLMTIESDGEIRIGPAGEPPALTPSHGVTNAGEIQLKGQVTIERHSVNSTGAGLQNRENASLVLRENGILRLIGNRSNDRGGGTFIDEDCSMTLQDNSQLIIIDNYAGGSTGQGGGGGFYNRGTITLQNRSKINCEGNSTPRYGGGFENYWGTIDVGAEASVTLSENTAEQGGGFFNLGRDAIVSVEGEMLINNNNAEQGGAFYNTYYGTIREIGGGDVSGEGNLPLSNGVSYFNDPGEGSLQPSGASFSDVR